MGRDIRAVLYTSPWCVDNKERQGTALTCIGQKVQLDSEVSYSHH